MSWVGIIILSAIVYTLFAIIIALMTNGPDNDDDDWSPF